MNERTMYNTNNKRKEDIEIEAIKQNQTQATTAIYN